jgi:hypothetical protein
MVKWLIKDELEGFVRKEAWPISRYNSGICIGN